MSVTEVNHLFSLAAGFVNQTKQHLFITGKAGTGKTTFLKYIKENSFKRIAVVAPTGVAAINAGGVTVHSLFQLPMGVYLPTRQHQFTDGTGEVNTEQTLLKNIRIGSAKRDLLRELELLIIDEVSMVRADMLDAIDAILRSYRRMPNVPFGGVQLLYIGDLFQLPPVANNREWSLLKEFYKSPFFFDSLVLQQAPPVYIELKKIYRQSDEFFINILNNIRHNECTAEDLETLQEHYHPTYQPGPEENFITLTSHNVKADAINKTELAKLPGKALSFEGTVKGDFNEKSFPVEKVIELKEGAQIMFIKNDKGEVRRFYNGKIGTVKKIEKDKIEVIFPGEEGELEIEKETWKNIRYQYDKEKDSIDEDELGSYTQYPIRLAWAITIHKSQGLTFDKAIIDAGESFAAGQVYVALSRLTSIDGLVLHSKINRNSIATDERVIQFAENELSEEALRQLLQQEQKNFVSRSIIETFDWTKLVDTLEGFYDHFEHRMIGHQAKAMVWANGIIGKATKQKEVALKFAVQLDRLLQDAEKDNYYLLHSRTKAAAEYFEKEVEALIAEVAKHAKEWEGKAKVKKYLLDLEGLKNGLSRKKLQIQQAVQTTTGLTAGLDAMALLQIVAEQRKSKTSLGNTEGGEDKKSSGKLPKGQTRILTLEMYKEGKSPSEIAVARNLSPTTIEGHLAASVATGDLKVNELVSEDKLQHILKAIEKTEGSSLTGIKEKLSDDISYGEIKAVLAYNEMRQQQHAAK